MATNPYGFTAGGMTRQRQQPNNQQQWGSDWGGGGNSQQAQAKLMGDMNPANNFNGQTSFGQGAGNGQELSAQGAYGGRSGWTPPQSVNRSAYNAVAPQRTAAQQNRWNNRSGGNFSNSVPSNYYQGIPSSNGAQQFGMGGQDPLAGYGGNGNPAQSGAPMQNRNRMGGGGNGASVMGAGGSIDGVTYSTDAAPPPGRGEPGAGTPAPPDRGGAGSDPINNPGVGTGNGGIPITPGQPGYIGQYPTPGFMGDPNSIDWWKNPQNQAAMQAYTNGVLPIQQLQQNTAQYASDFNEAQRRFDLEYGAGQARDQFQFGLSNRQFDLSQQQVNTAEDQWNRQFDWTQQGDRFNQGLATQDMGLRTNQQTFDQGLQNRQFGLAQQGQTFDQGLQNRQFGLQQQGQTFDQGLQNRQFGLQQQGQTFDQGLQNRQFGLQQQQFGLQQNNQAFNQGLQNKQFSLDTQQQQFAQGLQNRQFGLQQQNQTWNQGFQGQSLAQQAALARESNTNQANIAKMQAFGRFTAPNTKWQRNW